MTAKSNECERSTALKLIFACSGAADVGAIADRAARQLAHQGVGNMFCLAGIGGRVSGILKSTKAARAILTIDGCALDCSERCLTDARHRWVRASPCHRPGYGKG